MKLLIVTQAVDLDDPILGFFHRWIEEFAKHVEHVEVISLRKGHNRLPANVNVYSLGKELGVRSRVLYSLRFLSRIWRLRNSYDAVFVHMNPEYVILGGWLWRLLGKKIGLWYTHKSVDFKLRVAAFFANVILTASKESFRIDSMKARVMGHGIDTDFWTADAHVPRGEHLLSVGRLMESKRHDRAIRIAEREGKELRIAGDGPERASLEVLAGELHTPVIFLGPLSREALRDEYRRASVLIHTSETGSLDKVVLEALACGCSIRTDDPALKYMEHERAGYVRAHHSLLTLARRIVEELST